LTILAVGRVVLRADRDALPGVPSRTRVVRVAPTEATNGRRRTAVRNVARREWATTTPICGQACTTTPPLRRTARFTFQVFACHGFAALTT
jgi:hypothetical protein